MIEAPIRVSISLSSQATASRLALILSKLPEIELVAPGDSSDAAIADPQMPPPSATEHLTPREQEVLELMAEGLSNKDIARQLGISANTAKFHVHSVMDKLDAVGRTDAVVAAARKGVIQL